MKALRALQTALAALCLLAAGSGALAQAPVAVQDIEFVSLPGDRFQIELSFSGPPPEPEVFLIEDPARLSLDFDDVSNELDSRRYELDYGGAESVVVLESQGRTRMVVNLTAPTAYTTRIQDNRLFLVIGADVTGATAATVLGAAAQGAVAASDEDNAGSVARQERADEGDIRAIDFRRAENGAGQIVIDLARAGLIGNVNRAGSRLELTFENASLDDELQMRLDVADFATPVNTVDVYEENGNVRVAASMAGDYDYIAYQSRGQYILSISPLAAAQAAGTAAPQFPFTGERITLNFQDIEVRSVLQLLADFAGFSLVVGDSVTGNITLRLDDVPWDQALDLILRARGLDQRRTGSVLYVAPADEIASAELQALENSQQAVSLAPLVMEYIPINYAVANDLLMLLRGSEEGGGVLSDRGRASVDLRTNTLIVQDVEANLGQVRDMIRRLDVPVRQVLIEARIVNASTNFSKALGVRWGGAYNVPNSGDQIVLGGNMSNITNLSTNLNAYDLAVNQAVAGGLSLEEALATVPRPSLSFAENLVVDLGVPEPASSFALGFLGDDGLLSLELSALEATGNGEVIAQPKVATQDQQLARIESGVQIPYQAQAGGTAGGSTTEFIPALLSLEVTPQITPDNRIIMLLDIHQDSVVQNTGAVPAIATNSVNTRVLVNDGQTVVLGGVFREELSTTVSKTPLLGDLPYLGTLFKRTENFETKTELLIFITPSIINELR